MSDIREMMKDKKRIVVKIGSSSLQHSETGDLDYTKLDVLVRELCNLRNQGKDVVLVTSGAISVGKKALSFQDAGEDNPIAVKQAYAAVGQARLMMTKNTIVDNLNRYNAQNTYAELFKLGVIPVVNENDTVATYEIEIGDNDTLSAIVASLVKADLLLLLSDIDGLYTDDPRKNPNASYIDVVNELTDELMEMGKASTGSDSGTGGMNTKLQAAKIAGSMGVDMVIANSRDIKVIHRILAGQKIGTLFTANVNEGFDLPLYVQQMHGH